MEYVDNIIEDVLVEYVEYTTELLKEVTPDFIQNSNSTYLKVYNDRCDAISNALDLLIIEEKVDSYVYDENNKVFNCEYSNNIPFIIIPTDILESAQSGNLLVYQPMDKEYEGYDALIINTFENTTFRTEYYEEFVDKWIEKGMNVDYDDYVTVEELKYNLFNKKIICLSGHGTTYYNQPVFCLADEESNTETDLEYNLDIDSGRICKIQYSDETEHM